MDDERRPHGRGETSADELRRQAEERLQALSAAASTEPEDLEAVLHELRVHQIELEMQNEELRRAQEELEASRERYADLYDRAAVGYLTLDHDGHIIEANLPSVALLETDRSQAVGRALNTFIVRDDQDRFHIHRRQIAGGGQRHVCDLRLRRADGGQLWVRLEETVLDGDPPGVSRAALSDVTAQKEVEEANARLAAIVDSSDDAILSKTLDGVIATWNRGAERLYGYAAEEVIGESVSLLMPPGSRDELAALLDGIRRGVSVEHHEVVRVRKDGSQVDISLSVSPIRNAEGVIVGASTIARDVTEHKQVEAYSTTSREVLEALNDPGDLRRSIRRVLDVLKARTGFDAVGIRLRDGEDFPYYHQEGLSESFLLTEDSLLERAADGGVCRGEDGSVQLECTCGLVLSGGADPSSPLFTPGGSFWTNDFSPLLELTGDQEPRHNPHNQCIHDGYASVGLVPIRTEDGIVGLIHLNDRHKGRFTLEAIELLEGIASHVGEALMRKQAEAKILQLNSELEERVLARTAQLAAANKELEAFVYSASHDLRAPLRAIDGFSAMIAEDAAGKLSKDDLEHLERVRAAAQRMALLIDGLLVLSRASRGEMVPEDVDVSALAAEVAEELREADPDRQVEFAIAPEMRAEADPALLRAVLVNLLGNAWKFGAARATAHIRVGDFKRGHEHVFFVRDDGAGFDMNYAAHLFGAFQRMHPPGEFAGDGIGLATVQRLVCRHGGRVWAESAVEKGATFFFTLSEANASG